MAGSVQQSLFPAASGERKSVASKLADYDSRNLGTARYVLARYSDQPAYRCVVAWAELVIQRLGNRAERQVAA